MIIISAPSGAGKTTIIKELLDRFGCLEFSISATSRSPRSTERDGVDYYFLSPEEFDEAVRGNEFVEWEEVYSGTRYGTLRRELERIEARGHTVVFDVDVKGGVRLKEIFGDRALSVFIMPPSVEELRCRLVGRGTDREDTIDERVRKAAWEISLAPSFDKVVVNDCLAVAVEEAEGIIGEFLGIEGGCTGR